MRSDIFEFKITADDIPLGLYLLGFGQDAKGELFVLTSANLGPTGDGGQVWQIKVPGEHGSLKSDNDDD